jgi:DNA repair exonuclease SbcCD ATPase subunit
MAAEYKMHPTNGTGKWDLKLLKVRGFRSGSVLRVHMHNFLTFDDGVVFPGPRLNVVLGPNGTGKSTITHAICLACCGSPATVGKSLSSSLSLSLSFTHKHTHYLSLSFTLIIG